MEQLARLTDAIASAYLKYLCHLTGGISVKYGGRRGDVTHENLSQGLLANAVAAAKVNSKANTEAAAYSYLSPLLCLEGKEYRVTEWGVYVIEAMTRNALKKSLKPTIH